MDVPNLDTLAQQWRTFLSAPYIIVPPTIIVAIIVWWFRGTIFQPTIAGLRGEIAGLKGEIAGLREQIKVFGAQKTIFDAQMQLAAKELAFERSRHDSLARQINDLTEEAAKAGNNALSAKVAKLETALNELVAARNAVSSAIATAVGASAAIGISDSFPNTPLALRIEAEGINADKEGPK